MSGYKIYVGNMCSTTPKISIENIFNKFGEILSIRAFTDKSTGCSLGYAHIFYKEQEAAEKSLSMDGKEIHGVKIKVCKG